jgi:DNA-binding SARP family transcriptional activator
MTPLELQLHLLGGFRMMMAGRTIPLPATAAKLTALLALNGPPMSRTQIAGALWPEASERRATTNLRSIVWRLPPAAQSFVIATGATMTLADSVDTDLARARGVVRRVLEDDLDLDGDCGEELRGPAAVSLLCRPLLPEWDDDWLVFERERIRQLHIHALERLAGSLLEAGDPLSAVDIGIAVLGAEPLRESSHILVIRAHLEAGNRLDARRCYERYRDLVRQELDVEPALGWSDLADPGSKRSHSPRRRPAAH